MVGRAVSIGDAVQLSSPRPEKMGATRSELRRNDPDTGSPRNSIYGTSWLNSIQSDNAQKRESDNWRSHLVRIKWWSCLVLEEMER